MKLKISLVLTQRGLILSQKHRLNLALRLKTGLLKCNKEFFFLYKKTCESVTEAKINQKSNLWGWVVAVDAVKMTIDGGYNVHNTRQVAESNT